MSKSPGNIAPFSDRSSRPRLVEDGEGTPALIVLGMHRSGTSALTRVLSLSGYALPSTLMDPAADNEEGFWESRPISELNDQMLREVGSYWDDPFGFSPANSVTSVLSGFREQAVQLVRGEFPTRRPLVLKDPRSTILYDFWRDVLHEVGYQAVPIIAVRHPLEVAASLTKRNKFPKNKSLLIWMSYQLAAEQATRGGPRAFVTYESLMSDWRSCLDRLEKSLGLSLPRRDPEAELQIERFLRPDLRHHVASGHSGGARPDMPTWVGDAYEWFKAAASDAGADRGVLNAAIDEYTLQRKWFGPLVADLRLEVLDIGKRASEDVRQVESRLLEVDAAYRHEIATRDTSLQRSSEAIAKAESELAITQERLKILLRAHEENAHDLKRAQEANLEYRSEISRISGAYEAERTRREEEIRGQILNAQSVIASLQSDIVRAQTVVRDRSQQVERLNRENHEIRTSTLWRIMSPARWFGRKIPLLSRGSRSALGAIVRGKTGAPAQSQSFPLASLIQPPQTVASNPIHPVIAAARKAVKPEAIAQYLIAEYGDAEHADAWRQHCARFPLPIDPESQEKPNVALSDDEVAEWVLRCRRAGSHLSAGSENPDVSIIIPVYNQLAFTLSAIAAVYAQKTNLTYEILIGDDASSDQTSQLASGGLPRVQVVRHAKNVGFLLNCNIAAEQAKGAYIVLLNNDTVVLPNWLDELIGTLKADPKVGFVGSKLLYANGTLQEAGGIVWQDGSAWNWGRNQDPRDPRYCYAREVDYCSGASIALPMDLWRQLSGFDGATYENSYYEDVDLAFRVREAGRTIIYQPLSAVVHFEGISSGVDVNAGTKKYQVANGEHFLKRWRGTLKTHRPNAAEPVKESERAIKGRLLIIDSVTPTPDHDAGSLVMMETIQSFQACGWRVSFVPEDNFAHLPGVTSRLQRAGIEPLYGPHFKSVEEILLARRDEFEIVLISRVGPASRHLDAVRSGAPRAKVIFNTVDLHFLREQREAELSKDAEAVRRADKTRIMELNAISKSELTIVHSTVERDILARETPQAPVVVFPWVSPVRRPNVPLAMRRNVLFIGGFRHAPNVDGLRWFLTEIWPQVRAQAPDATFNVIGADAPAEFDAYNGRDGVTMMGWIQNLDPQLDLARVSVAPLRYGAGVKGKVISALSCGVPVVCTSIASEGTGMVPTQDVIVANEAHEFAASVLRIMKDDAAWASLSESGLRFVEQNYSRDAARNRVADMIAAVGLSA
ncbi:MAG: glycosyltransferase [Verrucomicrobiaceae bacterium]|nr:MAG: glycosyltransferase [Verrucomicrobiaceae bacterium]